MVDRWFVTTTPKYSMTSTWESVTKVMRTTTGLEGTAAEVGMMRTRYGELRIDDERAHTRRGERTRGRIWGLQSEVQGVYICTCGDPWYWVRTSGTTDDKAMVE